MIQRQSDSLSRSAHSRPHSLHILSVQPLPPVSSARQRAERAGWKTTRKATILSLSRGRSLDSQVARLQKRIPDERARRVKAASYVRKLKS